jgi:ribosomal protein S18 acetylase RimI-like enzyme
MMNRKIRPVRLHDIEPLHQRCFAHNPPEWVEELIYRARQIALQGRGLGVVMVTDDDLPIAYGQLTIWTRSGEISDLSVMSAYQGQGVGTALIDYLSQIAKDSHVQQVEIGALSSNIGALTLYRRLGFVDARILTLADGQQVQYLSKMTASTTPKSGKEDT